MWGDFFVRREWQLCIDLALDAMQEALDGNVHNKAKAKKKKKKKAKDKKKKKKKKEKGGEEEANAVWDLTELARGGAAMKLPVDGGGDGGSIARKRTASAAAAASSPGSSSGSDRGDLDGRPAPKRVKAAPVQTLVFGASGAVGAGGGYIPKVAAPGPQEVMSKLTFAVNNMNNIKQLADSGMLSASGPWARWLEGETGGGGSMKGGTRDRPFSCHVQRRNRVRVPTPRRWFVCLWFFV